VYFEQFDALEIFIASGKDLRTIRSDDIKRIDSNNRNFTITPTEKFFIQINATDGAQTGQFLGKMKLRYYEWDPRCGEFTIWDGSSCQPDYLTYCDSLTSDY
jgi:hypothetical protein